MIQLTNTNILMTHATTLAEYRLADNFISDVAALTRASSDALALAFLDSINNPDNPGQ